MLKLIRTSPWSYVLVGLALASGLLLIEPKILQNLFLTDGFAPHGYCFLWNADLLRLYVISNLLITLAYFSIPIGLVYLTRHRRDLAFKPAFLMFGAFILSCGVTHLVKVWTIWNPVYWMQGLVDTITAGLSIGTAVMVWPMIPQALALPSPTQLTDANRALNKEIAERKRVEEQLRASQRELREYIDHMSTLNVKLALDGAPLLMNRTAELALGLPREQLVRTNFLEGPWWTFDPEVHQRVSAAFQRATAGEAVNYDEKILVNGQALTISFGLAPVVDDGGRVGYVVAEGRDISAQKQAEEEVRRLNADLTNRAAELETANKELEAFSYSISHDLRAPLRAIDGFSRILLEEHAPQLPGELSRYLRLVRDNTRQMGQLVDDLLAFSRLSRQPLQTRAVTPTDLVRKLIEGLRAEQAERSIAFHLDELPACRADPTLLKQVWLNLLSNAVKFTGQRPEALIEIGSRRDNGEYVYFVKDNGVGFDMQYADKLFGVFQRLHQAEEYEGTGVGLAIVQRIIHRHGGRVWAEAEVNRGATFFFTLGNGAAQTSS